MTESQSAITAVRSVVLDYAAMESDRHRARRTRFRNGAVGILLVGIGVGGGFGVAAAVGTSLQSVTGLSVPRPTVTTLESKIDSFQRAQAAIDVVEGVPGLADSTFVPSSTRLEGALKDVKYFTGITPTDQICLLVEPTDKPEAWRLICGDGLPLSVYNPGYGSATLFVGSAPTAGNKLSPNLYVGPGSSLLG